MSPKATLTQETSREAGGFLFKLPKDESQALDMRTRINSEHTMRTLLYYGVMGEALDSDNARTIKDLIERLLISKPKGLGRQEAVTVLNQNLPKKVEIETGWDDSE